MIYTITAFTKDGKDKRVFGYYHSFYKACMAVSKNYGSMEECYYTWIVIEKVSPGIHGTAEVVAWYRWLVKKRAWYLRFIWPSWAAPKGCIITNFSIG